MVPCDEEATNKTDFARGTSENKSEYKCTRNSSERRPRHHDVVQLHGTRSWNEFIDSAIME